MRSRKAPGVARPAGARQLPAEGRAAVAAGDLRGAAVEREVARPCPRPRASCRRRGRAGCRRRRTASRSAVGSKASARRPGPEGGDERPVGEGRDAIDAEQRVSPQARARTDGPTASARRNPRRLRCRRRGRPPSVAASGARTRRSATARAGEPERREDRVGLGLDQLERVVAPARAGEDGLDLAEVGRRRRRPEVGDRDDRDVDRTGRRRRGDRRSSGRPRFRAADGGRCRRRCRRLWRRPHGPTTLDGARVRPMRRARSPRTPPGP